MKSAVFDTTRTGSGTREWSEHSVNIGLGCCHGCLYCYARADALHYGRISTASAWTTECVMAKAADRRYGRKAGVVMFPTTHDISPFYLETSLSVLHNLLAAGNQVLIVSKPHLDCIRYLCRSLALYREQILFRFTIGSLSSATAAFWEPGAPTPLERIAALELALAEGFRTSVSAEPMLEGVDGTVALFDAVRTLVTETIWIGKMNRASQRLYPRTAETHEALARMEMLQADRDILSLVRAVDSPIVRWKESIARVWSAGV